MSEALQHITRRTLRSKILHHLGAGVCACALLLAGCSSHTETSTLSDSSDILVTVGDSSLTITAVQALMPRGLSPEDSTAMFNSIVEGWLEQMLLSDLGQRNIVDMERIDRLTADYRKKLIVAEYRRNVRDSHSDNVSQANIDSYFASHKDEMMLDTPVVKGLYVKIPADSERLSDVRRWMMTATPDAIDNLEEYGLRDAIEYSFFDNHWTPWSDIASQIPYRFGDVEDFIKKNPDFETTYRGITYFLHISESLPAGSEMPREIADPLIRERLEALYGDKFEQRIINDIYRKAESDGHLKYGAYHRENLSSSHPAK